MPYAHSIVNKRQKTSNSAGFTVLISINTMKKTIVSIILDI